MEKLGYLWFRNIVVDFGTRHGNNVKRIARFFSVVSNQHHFAGCDEIRAPFLGGVCGDLVGEFEKGR